MTDKDIEVTTVNNEAEDEETKPVEVYSEKADTEAPDLDSEQIKAAASVMEAAVLFYVRIRLL